jgi:hypothetical protein
MSDGIQSRRRRFRFSLRTMFLLLTAVCLWLGWNVQIVQERNFMRHEIRRNGGYLILEHTVQHPLDANDNQVMGNRTFNIQGHARQIPFVRRLLGDTPVQLIQVRRKVEVAGTRRVFPECKVVVDPFADRVIHERR